MRLTVSFQLFFDQPHIVLEVDGKGLRKGRRQTDVKMPVEKEEAHVKRGMRVVERKGEPIVQKNR